MVELQQIKYRMAIASLLNDDDDDVNGDDDLCRPLAQVSAVLNYFIY